MSSNEQQKVKQESGRGPSPTVKQEHKPGQYTDGGERGNWKKKKRNRKRRGDNNNGGNGAGSSNSSTSSSFKGACKDLNGHVFQVHCESKNPGQYNRTCEEIFKLVTKDYKYGHDVGKIIQTLEETDLSVLKPRNLTPDEENSPVDKKIWEAKVDNYVKRCEHFDMNRIALFSLVWGQCSDAMIAHLKTLKDWELKLSQCDCLWLLLEVQKATAKFESHKYLWLSVVNAHLMLFTLKQDRLADHEYHTRFLDTIRLLKHYGAELGTDSILVKKVMELENRSESAINALMDDKSCSDYKQYETIAQNRYFAMVFLHNANEHRYGSLVRKLENAYSSGQNIYPASVTDAYNLMLNYKPESNADHNARSANKSRGKDDHHNKSQPTEDSPSVSKEQNQVSTQNRDATSMAFVNKGDGSGSGTQTPSQQQPSSDNKQSGISQVTLHTDVEDDVATALAASNVTPSPFNSCFTQVGVSCTKSPSGLVPRTWFLLDNESTENIICNDAFLTDIYKVPPEDALTLHGTGGSTIVNYRGTLPGFGEVWYSSDGIANILSFADVEDRYKIDYIQSTSTFLVHAGSRKIPFRRHGGYKLYYYDAGQDLGQNQSISSSPGHVPLILLATDSNKVPYTKAQLRRAERVGPVYASFNYPDPKLFQSMADAQSFRNAPFNASDVRVYLDLLERHEARLQGKTVRNAPQRPDPHGSLMPPPLDIIRTHMVLTLCIDIFYAVQMPFLATVSRDISFMTIHSLPNRKMIETVLPHIKSVIELYKLRGFKPSWILSDMEFRCLEQQLLSLGVRLNTTAENEHVGEVERGIRVIKEDCRGILAAQPYNEYPLVIVREAVLSTAKPRNMLLRPNGISNHLSPGNIVTGEMIDASRMNLPFGTYCHIKMNPTKYNAVNEPRTMRALALRPLGNAQGGYLFLRLDTWAIVARYQWVKFTKVPADVIELIINKAREEKNKRTKAQQEDVENLVIRRSDKTVVTSLLLDDSELVGKPPLHQRHTVPEAENDEDHNDEMDQTDHGSEVSQPQVNDDEDEDITSEDGDVSVKNRSANEDHTGNRSADESHTENRSVADKDEEHVQEQDGDELNNQEDTQMNGSDVDDGLIDDTPTLPAKRDRNAAAGLGADLNEDNILSTQAEPDRPGTTTYHLRKRMKFTWDTSQLNVSFVSVSNPEKETVVNPPVMANCSNLWGIALNQMTAQKGINLFGDKAREALIKEWTQLNDLEVYEGVYWNKLTREERKGALRLVQLIKEKRSSKIKGRTCVDGRPQRDYISKEDSTSPTVTSEGLFLVFLTAAHEERIVGTVDIPGVFLTTKTDENVIVIVDGVLVDMLIRSNSEYRQFVYRTQSGRNIVYLRLLKAMYGTLRAARLFYERLTGYLVENGFTLNPYDTCVANKIIDGHQCTIAFHVDDLVITHKSRSVVESMMKLLSDQYGELDPCISSTQDYVGMTINFPGDRSVHITMKSYLETSVSDFTEIETLPDRSYTTPCGDHLFQVNEQSERLDESKRELFHKIVARLLYVSTRARPDIHPTIAFLTTRCTKADVDDWKKLRRLLTYIRDTIDLPLILKADSLSVIKFWVDAAYGVRHNYKSQTGATMSFGTGTFQNKSVQQGLNVKSSTEAEVVAASDMVPYQLWTRYFMEAQGYDIDRSILYQDNESAILLERNGRLSSGRCTKHIHIRFFWLHDRVRSNDLEIEYCGTNSMVADFFTKPLQGSKFLTFRDQILGHIRIPDFIRPSNRSQKRVEDND